MQKRLVGNFIVTASVQKPFNPSVTTVSKGEAGIKHVVSVLNATTLPYDVKVASGLPQRVASRIEFVDDAGNKTQSWVAKCLGIDKKQTKSDSIGLEIVHAGWTSEDISCSTLEWSRAGRGVWNNIHINAPICITLTIF